MAIQGIKASQNGKNTVATTAMPGELELGDRSKSRDQRTLIPRWEFSLPMIREPFEKGEEGGFPAPPPERGVLSR